MSQANIQTSSNRRKLIVTANHVEGNRVTLEIEPNEALFDEDGMIRFFKVDFGDRGVQAYKLHPYHTVNEQRISWVVDFLAGYGLSRVGSKIVKNNNNREEIHLARYFTFSNPGGQTIRSFISDHFLPEHLGYHNIMTDKLVWVSPIYVR